MVSFLDLLLTIVHITLMAFNLTGWIWAKTRIAHRFTLALTLLSWAVLGIWYGPGYCPLTDWHWDIKAQLGEKNLPDSFVKYVLDRWFNGDFPSLWVDRITLAGLIFAIVMAIVVWVKQKAVRV